MIVFYGESRKSEAEALKMHKGQGCSPRQALAKIMQTLGMRKICSADRCLTRLGEVNKFVCKACGQWTCLRHRFADGHPCGQKVGKRV
jgi:hypothetical protein